MPIRFIIASFFFLLSLARLSAQDVSTATDTLTGEDTILISFGYIVVECDSPGTNIYVDDMLAGQIPISRPIPLSPGRHTVTYLQPEYLELLRKYYNEEEVKKMISRALETVYVVPGQTVSVYLWWRPYQRELKSRKFRFWVKSLVGIVLAATLLGLNVL